MIDKILNEARKVKNVYGHNYAIDWVYKNHPKYAIKVGDILQKEEIL